MKWENMYMENQHDMYYVQTNYGDGLTHEES